MRRNMNWLKYLVFLSAIMLVSVSAYAQATDPQSTLQQYIADLQKNPDNNAIREKIIKFAQEMKPAPKISNEVDELIGKATYIFKNAKNEAEFNDAVDAYQKALLIAPWVPEYYYNLGAVQEKAGKLKEAANSLNLYLLAAPEAKDAKEVREHIGGLKYAAEKTAKESSPEAVASKKQDESELWLKSLDGARFASNSLGATALSALGTARAVMDIQGGEAIAQSMLIRFDDQETARLNPRCHPGEWVEDGRAKITGGQFTLQKNGLPLVCTISKDGNKIACVGRNPDGSQYSYDYYRSMER